MVLSDLLSLDAIKKAYNRTAWSAFRKDQNSNGNLFAMYLKLSFDEYTNALENIKNNDGF